MDSWRDMTLGDVAKGFTRYRPFILAVMAMLLVLVALPSDQRPTSNASGDNTAVRVEGATQDNTSGATGELIGRTVTAGVVLRRTLDAHGGVVAARVRRRPLVTG
jgi:hypothetical protein